MIEYTPHPSFHIGSLTIYTWGTIIALGFLLSLFIALRESKMSQLDENRVFYFFLYLFLSLFIGARIVFIILLWPIFSQAPIDSLKIWQGGYIIFGGVIIAILSSLVYVWFQKLPLLKFADALTPSFIISLISIHIADFISGQNFGTPSDLPWSFIVDTSSRHPIQLYYTLLFIGVVILMMTYPFNRKYHGTRFFLFLLLYSLIQIILDPFSMTIASSLLYYDLSISQIMSIIIFIFSLTVVYILYKRPRIFYKNV